MAKSALTKPDSKSLKSPRPTGSPSHTGSSFSSDEKFSSDESLYPTLALLRKYHVAPTRENYLLHNWGDPNKQLDAESEAMMPPQFRKL